MTATYIRSLLLALADKLDHYHQSLMDDRRCTHPLADRAREVAAQQPTADAPQAAADAEFEACCAWLQKHWRLSDNVAADIVGELRAARRPPAPSEREQALALLDAKWAGTTADGARIFTWVEMALMRRALEGGDD